MGLWLCTHIQPSTGTTSRILHDGKQCSLWNQDADCAYFQASWEFVKCERAIVEDDKGTLKVGRSPQRPKKKR